MKSWFTTEDGWAVWLGLFLIALGLPVVADVDLLGWTASTKVWTDPGAAVVPVSKTYARAGMTGGVSLVLTFLFVLALTTFGAWCLGLNLRRFVPAFTVIFWVSYLCWIGGHFAYIAATPNQLRSPTNPRGFDIPWSLGLTSEAGYLVALIVGLILGNFFPGAVAWLKDAARPEWYIKTAIVVMGASLGVKAAPASELVTAIMFRGLAAIIEAYLIYWALVYFIARKYFKFSREWAAPLASGISICGVSAAITTGAAIRARPQVPIMVSSLVVLFSVVELLILPFAAQSFLWMEPLVAAAWIGLAVKTDGAAFACGQITETLILARAAEEGIHYQKELMVLTTTTVKLFIDIFIGIWAFVLALVWAYGIDKKKGQKVPVAAIVGRFPKFVAGYFLGFVVLLTVALSLPHLQGGLKTATAATDLFRQLFFVMTFFTIGLAADFKKLWAEGFGRLALVYAVSLFGFVIWIGLAISWLFFHGAQLPTVPGSP